MKRSNWMKVNHDILKSACAVLAVLTMFLAPANAQEKRGRMVNPAQAIEAPQIMETRTIAADVGAAGREYASFLPANLYVHKDLRLLLEKMWMRSPTFRQQCERIGQTPGLVVSLRVTPRPGTIRHYRALTRVGKAEDGATIAKVRIFNPSEMVQLIGHEFEHILEHLEGLDLQPPAVQKQLAAYRTADGFYETQRAIEAGRRVYSEYGDARVPKHRAVASGTATAVF